MIDRIKSIAGKLKSAKNRGKPVISPVKLSEGNGRKKLEIRIENPSDRPLDLLQLETRSLNGEDVEPVGGTERATIEPGDFLTVKTEFLGEELQETNSVKLRARFSSKGKLVTKIEEFEDVSTEA